MAALMESLPQGVSPSPAYHCWVLPSCTDHPAKGIGWRAGEGRPHLQGQGL